jgi:hypothetical protein
MGIVDAHNVTLGSSIIKSKINVEQDHPSPIVKSMMDLLAQNVMMVIE